MCSYLPSGSTGNSGGTGIGCSDGGMKCGSGGTTVGSSGSGISGGAFIGLTGSKGFWFFLINGLTNSIL